MGVHVMTAHVMISLNWVHVGPILLRSLNCSPGMCMSATRT